MTSQQLGALLEQTGQPRISCVPQRASASGKSHVPAPSKYRAVRTVDADGTKWDSKAERARWVILKLMESQKLIVSLVRQPRFDIIMNGIQCGFYRADFAYYHIANISLRVIEDVKSAPTKTAVYRLKKKLVEAQYGIKITEIT